MTILTGGLLAQGSYPIDPGPVDASSREAVRQHYLSHMASSDPVPFGYTGSPANGIAGDISPDHRAAYLHRINAFRRLAGIAPIILIDNSRNTDWQAGAMMCAVDRFVGHTPPTTARYYSPGGAYALGHSQLFVGPRSIAESVHGFIWDWGASNTAAAHRRSFLATWAHGVRIGVSIVPAGDMFAGARADVVGFLFEGTDPAVPILPIGSPSRRTPEAWPSPGFFPKQAIPGRWSWHLMPDWEQIASRYATVSSQTTVSVSRNGVALPVTVIHRGSDGLVWTLDGTSEGELKRTGPGDETYDVTISGIDFRQWTWDNVSTAAVPSLRRSVSYRVIGVDTNAPGEGRIAPPAFAPVLLRGSSTAFGDTVTVCAAARGATSYTWKRNDAPIPGATSDRLSVKIMPDTTGEYSVTAHSAYGQTEGFIPVGIYALRPMPSVPVISFQSSSMSVVEGSPFEFWFTASSDSVYPEAFPKYQWYKDGVPIPGATSYRHSSPAASKAHAGTYTCVASNVAGSVTSAQIQLTVQSVAAPVITWQTGDTTIIERSPLSLIVNVASLAPVAYQWSKDGVLISGATTATLTWSSVPLNAAGTYVCVASNSAASITSSPIRLNVQQIFPPTFTRQPQDNMVSEGASVSISVIATSAVPVTYQWFKGAVLIPGATSASLSWSRVTSSDAGTYTCVATNAIGSATSSPARLTVLQVPAPTFTRQPIDKNVVDGAAVSFDVLTSSSLPVTLQWYKDGTPVLGATTSMLSWSRVTLIEAGTYTCVATNASGSTTSAPARLTVQRPPAPNFTQQPFDKSVSEDSAASFEVATNSALPVTYQWFKDGAPITGATSTLLWWSNVTSTNAGTYTCVATNASGSTTSSPARLTVQRLPVPIFTQQPSDKSVSEDSAASFEVATISPLPVSYQWFKDGTPVTGATSSLLWWSKVTSTAAGIYTCVATNASGSTTSSGARLTVQRLPAPTFTRQPLDMTVAEGTAVSFDVGTSSSLPVTYQWFRDGTPVSGATSSALSWANVPLSAAGLYSCVVNNANGSTTSSPARLTVQAVSVPIFMSQSSDQTVVERSAVALTVTVASLVPVTYQWFKNDSSIPGSTANNITWSRITSTESGTYTCVASNSAGSTTSAPILLTVQQIPAPTISQQPTDKSVAEGAPVSLSIWASSPLPVTYQWYKDGTPIAGSTSSILSWTKVTIADAGTYTCVATNANGSTTSNPGRLTVQKVSAPTFIVQPSSISTTVGTPVGFNVTVSGFPNPVYQWRKDGITIPGAIGPSHVIAVSRESDAGTYTCIATNSAGSATSNPATLSYGPTAWLSNVSVRTALNPYQVVIVGLTVHGGSKDMIVRAAGPALSAFGVPGAMADPLIELYAGGAKITTNDNWPSSLGPRFPQVGAFGFPAESKDAAILQPLQGGYTVQVSGQGGGVVLVEGYDAGSGTSSRLVNLSARNRSGVGGDVLIAGFNVAGTGTIRVLVRGIGPALAAYGVPGTLVDPKLEIFSSSGTRIADNDNWASELATTFTSVGAFGFSPNSKDAATVLTLEAGRSYTVQVSGANSGTGEAMIEVYEVP